MPKVWSLVERREEEEEEGRRERMKVEEVRRILEGWREAGKGAGVMGDEWVVEAVREEERRGE
jgi:hypothetical protein